MTYNPALDGIRAIAILMVIGCHARVPGLDGGFVGVDVFFVLSGYLITTLLLAEHRKTGGIDLSRFYIRRARRLYPALLLLLAVYLVVAPHIWSHYPIGQHFRDAFWAATYTMDYVYPYFREGQFLKHTWSLAVEEQFYLIWPLALLGLLKLPSRNALQLIALIVLAEYVAQLVSISTYARQSVTYMPFHLRMGGLMVGALAAFLLPSVRTMAATVSTAAGLAGLLACAVLIETNTAPSTYALGMPAAQVAAVCLILGAQQCSWLGVEPLRRLGLYSYGLYLWHGPVVRAFHKLTDLDWPIVFALGGGLSLLLAMLSYHTVEAFFRQRHVEHARDSQRLVVVVDPNGR